MTPAEVTTSRGLEPMAATLELLGQQLGELGLNLSVWDPLGQPVGPFQPCRDFCELIRRGGGACLDGARTLAGQVAAGATEARTAAFCGGCALGLPILCRRRLVGEAVACFPTRQMLDEESIARLCDRVRLDRTHMVRLAAEACRHDAEEADVWLRVIGWLLERGQAAHVAQDELAALSGNLASTYEELSLLYRVSGVMRVSQRPRESLKTVCNELIEVVSMAAAAVVVEASRPAQPETVVSAGRLEMDDSQLRDLLRSQLGPRFAKSKRAVLDNRFVSSEGTKLAQAIRNLIAVPLVVEDRAIGVLIGLNKTDADFDSIDLKLISSIGNQTSIFLANRRLYEDLQDLLMGVLHALTATIDAKDPYTCGHSQRVAEISRRLAQEMRFPAAKVERIYLCGLLHDVGKVGVPESTLRKKGRLTAQEFQQVKRHPDIGAMILSGIRQLEDVIDVIRSHHERPDGKGYPRGSKGDEIPMESRILGLADSFDAMTSDRTYRKALPLDGVIQELRRYAGTQFDPQLVDVILSMDLRAFLEELRHSAKSLIPVSLTQEVRP